MRRKIIGIYKITSPSNKIYIGQSVDVWNRHSSYKNAKCKRQHKIYNSIMKYGWDAHVFEVQEECRVEDLSEREGYWQDFYDVLGENGLNCRRVSSSDRTGYDSKETINKRANALKGVKKPSITGEKHHYFGRVYTEEEKKLIAKGGEKRKGALNVGSLDVIDLNTGVFYHSIVDLSTYIESSYVCIRKKLNGYTFNNTPYMLCYVYEQGLLPHEMKTLIKRVGANSPCRREVINTNTLKIYPTIKDACEDMGISRSKANHCLNKRQKNDINLVYIEDYESTKNI